MVSSTTAETAAQMGRKTRAGMIWSVGTGLLSRGVGLLTTLLLTRYLSPEQSGTVTVALTLVLSVSTMTTIGLGQYVTSQRQPSPRVAWNAMMLHVPAGLLIYIGVLFLASPLSAKFGAAGAARYIPLFVLTFVMDRISYVPERVLVAHMRFRQVSLMRTASELTYCGAAIVLAMLGLGPWAIVLGNVLRQAVRMGLNLRYSPPGEWYVPEGPDWQIQGALVRFGVPLMLAGIAAFASKSWDNLLVSHYYGADVLGLYNLAYNLALVPAVQVAEMAADVLAPSLARLDGEERRKAAVDMLEMLAVTVFPLAVGLSLVSESVADLLPRKWSGIAPFLMVLSVMSLTRPAGLVLTVYLQALRRPLPAVLLMIVQVVLLLGSLVLVGRAYPRYPLAVCYAVSAAFLLGSALSVVLLRKADGVPAWPLIRAQLRPLPALLLMSLFVVGLNQALAALPLSLHALPHLLLQVLAGGVGYLLGVRLFLPRVLQHAVELIRKRGG